ncbi:MAG: hypothetical protein AAB403_18880, partial [Planctomycetota bacterium]
MAKKRTGLQSNIASIFSGVPIPKKGQPGSEPPSAAPKADGSDRPKPPVPQPRVPPPPRSGPPARVPPAAVPERKISQVPSKIPRRKKARAPGLDAGASPTRQKVSIALVLILSVVLLIVLGKPFGTPGSGPVVPGNTGPVAASVSPRANVKIDWPVPDVYPAELRDPMIAGSQGEVPVQAPGMLVVTAITYSDDRKIA